MRARMTSAGSIEEDEADAGRAGADPVAIAAAQRRAGDDQAGRPLRLVGEARGDALEPGPAVGVGERRAGLHAGDALRRMQAVAVDEAEAERLRRCRRRRSTCPSRKRPSRPARCASPRPCQRRRPLEAADRPRGGQRARERGVSAALQPPVGAEVAHRLSSRRRAARAGARRCSARRRGRARAAGSAS